MDLDAILAKAGATPAAPSAEDDERPAFLTKRPKGGMDLDAILRKAGSHPDDAEAAPTTPDRIGAANADYAANVAGLKSDASAIPTLGQQARQVPVLGSVLRANDVAAQAVAHPISAARGIGNAVSHPIQGTPDAREFMRGVNDNIPFANRAVGAIGGPPSESAEDQAAAVPGMRDFGGVAGMPAASMVGGIAAKGIEAAAPVVQKVLRPVSDAAQSVGSMAQDIQAARAARNLEVKVKPTTRAALRSDAVKGVVVDYPELRKAAASGNDAKVAQVTAAIKQKAQSTLAPIYEAAGPADEAVAKAVGNVDERISRLAKSVDVNDRAAAAKLTKLRDEFNESFGARETTSGAELRQAQSSYQKNGYAKNIAGDPEVSASILAQREMSKAVGDAVIDHVTGMDYSAAKAAAAKDPRGLAAKLFKANDDISAANKIEASLADRAGKAPPPGGFAKLVDKVKHPIHTAVDMAAAVPSALGQKAVDAAASLADTGRVAAPAGPTPTFVSPPVQPQQPTPRQAAAVARLLQSARQGATRQQLQAQAQQDGTPPELAANIAQQFGR